MTRHYVNSSEVAHLWAHQAQDWAQGSHGNFSFTGPLLKSYWLTIGRILEDKDGRKVALVLSDWHTMTTKQHISVAQNALGYGDSKVLPWWIVDSLDAPTGDVPHAQNVASIIASYKEAMAANRRKRDMPHYVKNFQSSRLEAAKEYAAAFDIETEWPDFDADWAELEEYHRAKFERNNTPAKIAERERKVERERAKVREDYRNGTGKFAFQGSEHLSYRQRSRYDAMMTDDDRAARKAARAIHFAAKIEEMRPLYRSGEDNHRFYDIEDLFTAEDKTAREAAILVKHAAQIEAWRRGSTSYVPRTETALLRIRGGSVETSWGAVFPVADAKRVYPLLLAMRGRAYKRGGLQQFKLGPYVIDKIDEAGNVTAGCHHVMVAEIDRAAGELGIGGALWERDR